MLLRMHFIQVFIKIGLGAFFIFSAWLKLAPIEPFEFLFVDLGICNWTFAPYFSRTVIGMEFFIGAWLISQMYHKQAFWAALSMLVFFSFFLLLMLITKGNNTDCGCMGLHYKMSPLASLGKNALLIVLLGLTYKAAEYKWKFKKPIFYILLLTALSMPYILEHPDINVANPYKDETGYRMQTELLGKWPEGISPVEDGKKILCFFSTGCRFCRLAGYKLSIIQKKLGEPIPAYYIFWSDEADLPSYWEESKSHPFPYKLVPTETFFKLSGSELPAVYLLEDGVVKAKLPFRNLEEETILRFLNE